VTVQHSIDQLVEILSDLSVLDMSKLKTALEDKWGVKAAAAALSLSLLLQTRKSASLKSFVNLQALA